MRPSSGGAWPGPLRNANTIARIMEATDWYFREIASGRASNHPKMAQPSTGRLKIKNVSGAARRKGELLQVGDYGLTDVSRRTLWHKADVPDASGKTCAVLLHALQEDEIGEAQISGVCPALVNVTDADHGFAEPKDGNDLLQSAVAGRAEILWKPSGAGGETECIVNLGARKIVHAGAFCHDLYPTLMQVLAGDVWRTVSRDALPDNDPDVGPDDALTVGMTPHLYGLRCDHDGCYLAGFHATLRTLTNDTQTLVAEICVQDVASGSTPGVETEYLAAVDNQLLYDAYGVPQNSDTTHHVTVIGRVNLAAEKLLQVVNTGAADYYVQRGYVWAFRLGPIVPEA